MKTAVITGEKEFTICDTPMPDTKDGKVLVKVSKVGVCGSDLHYWAAGGSFTKGWILGHEFAGVVVDPGFNDELKKGDRVMAIPSFGCDTCEYCVSGHLNHCQTGKLTDAFGNGKPGAYAEYIATPYKYTFKLPDAISDEEATLIEPCAVGSHVIKRANIEKGDKVLIVGAGIIGLLTAMWCKIEGKASYIAISETVDSRIEMAKKYGFADFVFDAKDANYLQNLKDANGGGFDKLIDCVGLSQTVNVNMKALKPNKDIIMAGVPLGNLSFDMNRFVINELHMCGSHGYDVDDVLKTIQYLEEGKINLKQFVTKEVPLDEVQAVFEDLTSGNTKEVKVLLKL